MSNTEVTTTDIEDLMQGARMVGNDEMVALCRRALADDTAAHALCVATIRYYRREHAHEIKHRKEKEHD